MSVLKVLRIVMEYLEEIRNLLCCAQPHKGNQY